MTGHAFSLAGAALIARPSGALWWPEAGLLAVADLHLGKSGRIARRGGTLLPPYETAATLSRLDAEIEALSPARVICLGDSFDDAEAGEELAEDHALWLLRMMAGRDWTWLAGNHDPVPPSLGGSFRAEWQDGPLTFRHIAEASAAPGEVSAHYHPKMSFAGRSRPCFVVDSARVILPAFGAYTGGLACRHPHIAALTGPGAIAVLTGAQSIPVPLAPPRPRTGRPLRLA